MAKKKPEIIGYIDDSGTFHEGETYVRPSKTTSAPAMVQVAQTVKPTINNNTQNTLNTPKNDIRTVDTVNEKKEEKPKQDSLKDAIKKYGDTIKNSAVKNRGLSWDNAVTDLANIYDARKNLAKSIPVIGDYVRAGDTATNIATNMGTGALKTLEGAADTASDLIFNPYERNLNYAYDLITKGKKTADENLKDLTKMQQRDIKKNMTQDIQDKTGYSDIVDDLEKDSLVKRDNFGGQVAQGVGGMVPALVMGQAFASAPELTNLSGLTGKQKLAAMAGNVGKTYISQLPSNAILGASSYGSGVEEALNDGVDMNKARLYGLTNAAIEQGTEMLTGGVPGLEGKGGLDQLMDPLINKNTNGYLNALLRAGYGAFGEGLEESAGTYLDALARRGLLGQDIDWNQVNKEALQAGLLGATTGAILNSPSNIQDFQNVKTENQVRNAIGDAEYAEGNQQYNPDYKGWENQRKENRIENERKEINDQQRREEVNRIQQERAQEEARKAQELAQEQQKEQERIKEQENQKQAETTNKNVKNPELNADIKTFQDVKSDYGIYKRFNPDKFDYSMLDKAKETIEGSKRYGRTKQEWLDVAKNIGTQAENMDSNALKKYAFESYAAAVPYHNMNKQGQNVSFGIHEWVKAVYDGAKVGTPIETQQITKNEQEFNNKETAKNVAEVKEEPVLKVETPEQEKQHYVDSGMNEETANILSEMPKPEKQSIREKIKDGKAKLSEEWSYLKRNLVDKGETIYNLGKKTKNPQLYAKYDKRGTTTGEANYDIGVAQTDLKGKRFNNFTDADGNKTSMSLNQIWEGVDPQIANEYLAHYLNVDRYNQTNQDGTQKYVFGESITDKDSLKRVKQLEKEHPELKRFGENVWQYGKNQLQNMVDAGKISQAQADSFLKETPHYVRLQRNVENTSSPLLEFDRKGNVKVNKNIKEFKGSTLDILPFKESMAQYTLDVRNSIRDNLFAQELAKTLGVGADGEAITDIEDYFGTNPELLKDNGDGTYSLTFFNKGVATTIPINEGIYESLQPNKHYKFEDALLFKGVRKFDNIRKALLTDKNPMFLATNMMKDAFDAPLNSKYPVLFAKNYPRALAEIIRGGENYQQYQALGGLQNSYFDNQQFQKQGNKYSPLTWIEKANNAIEQIPRLAEFMSTMEKTGDVDQAMYNAAEVTTNFKRGGDVTKAANRNGATFLNASVQGFDKQIRNFTDIQSPKQAVQMLGKVLALGIAPGLLNDLMWEDDDEYKDMQDYQKDRYYLFKGKDGNWIRIPKGRAVSIFQSAARRTKYAMRGQEDAYKDFGKFASSQVAPNNPFENNIISPFVDVARNESWSGNKIVSDSIKNETHPEEEYTIKTDEFSKWLGKKTGKSPAKINYLIDQYSGAIGDIVLPNITKKVSSKSDNVIENTLLNPIKDKFTTNAVTSNKSQNDFYEALSRAEDNKKWSKATDEDKARYKYLYNKNLEISDIRKEMNKVQESDMSNKEKYDEVMDYTKEINRISKEAVNNSKNIEKPSKNEYVIGDKHYVATNGQVNALKDETVQMAKQYGLSVGDYADITSHYGSIKADKDENGNTIAGSKKKKFIDYVEAKEELTQQQKIAIIQKYYKKYTGE